MLYRNKTESVIVLYRNKTESVIVLYRNKPAPVEVLSLEERNRYSTQRSARLSGEGNEDNLRVTTGHHPDRKVTDQSSTATLQHVVEMAFVVDYADYAR